MIDQTHRNDDTNRDAEFLRRVLDAIPSHVAVLDDRGVVVEVNEPWRRFAGGNDGDVEALGPGVDYLAICDRAAQSDAVGAADVARGIREVIGGVRESYHMCYPCHSPEEQRWYQVRVTRCPDLDPVRVVVSHETITEAQQLEQMSCHYQSDLAHMMRLSTINEMATGLAHELNQPLATISNFASGCLRRLERGRGDEQTLAEALETIVTEAQRAGEILRRVRRFIRKDPSVRVAVKLRTTALDAAALVAAEAREAGVEIDLDLADDAVVALGDPVQVQQVMVNIVRNAIEAISNTDKDLAERRVTMRIRRDHPRTARVDIVDTGPGIAPSLIPMLFDPFYSTKSSSGEDDGSGMGLGLSLCRSIIDAHRAELRADPNRHGGLTFSFTLPLHEDDSHHG